MRLIGSVIVEKLPEVVTSRSIPDVSTDVSSVDTNDFATHDPELVTTTRSLPNTAADVRNGAAPITTDHGMHRVVTSAQVHHDPTATGSAPHLPPRVATYPLTYMAPQYQPVNPMLIQHGYRNPNSGYIHMLPPNMMVPTTGYINVQHHSFPYLEAGRQTAEQNDYITLPQDAAAANNCVINAPAMNDVTATAEFAPPPPIGHTRNTGFNQSASGGGLSSYIPSSHSQMTFSQPPGLLQHYLDNLYIRREFARLLVGPEGGIFGLFSLQAQNNPDTSLQEVMVSIQPNSVSENCQLFFLRSRNFDDFPQHVASQYYHSDVIHMLPHSMTFAQPVSIRIPLRDGVMHGANGRELSVMCSESNSGEKNPTWRTLQQNTQGGATDAAGADTQPQWFFADGCLHLFVTRFCMVVVVDESYSSRDVSPPRSFVASLSIDFRPALNAITAVVRFEDKAVTAAATDDDARMHHGVTLQFAVCRCTLIHCLLPVFTQAMLVNLLK